MELKGWEKLKKENVEIYKQYLNSCKSSNVTSKHYLQKTNPMEVRNNIIQLRKKLGIF
ncbi:MAG: hypothetical protein HXM14_00470 [Fusobacterium periodonticum]|nr:hypothetical protein [Fusobacterium periodonticum]